VALLSPLTAGATEDDQYSGLKVATVNGDAITIKDLRSQFKNRHGGHTKFLGGEEELRTFLRITIEDRLLLQEAYALGLDSDPAVKTATDAFEINKAGDYLVKVEVDQKSEPSADDVRAVWDNYGNFLVQVREIGVAKRTEAEEIRTSLLHGGDAEALARSCSLLMTRQNGGLRRMGWGADEPPREGIILALEPGDVSPVLEIDGGFLIVRCEARLDAMRPEFEQVKEAIAGILRKRMKEARQHDLSSEVWNKYHAQIVAPDLGVASIAAALASAQDTVVAKWDGGQLTVRQSTTPDEMNSLATLSAEEGRHRLENSIRATVNASLFGIEARARKLNEVPEIAGAVTDFREKLMLDALYGEHILKNFKISDDDARVYYEAHKASFFEPEKRRVAQILVSSERDAKAVVAQLAKGADFAQLASAKSRDITTSGSGGDLGWITADHVPPAFSAVLKLPAGKYTQPIRTVAGWHVIKVTDLQPKRALSFDESRQRASSAVSEEKKRAMREVWMKKLRDAAEISVDDNAIREFVKANPLDPTKPAPAMDMPGMANPSGANGATPHGGRPATPAH
jgi:peptidyl-prolyl cis-trans isomerase C